MFLTVQSPWETLTIFEKIVYATLNIRQQENYNFQKIAGPLADYGYNCIHLNDDWQGADFLAVHVNGDDILRVRVKGRLAIDKKYLRKEIWIAFHMTRAVTFSLTTISFARRLTVARWTGEPRMVWRGLP